MTEASRTPLITSEETEFAAHVIRSLSEYYHRNVVGQDHLKDALITAILADGHVLIESVPGLAKTSAAKAMANAVNASFSRIQCTPDLLPGDITGTQIYRQDTGKFETVLGPVFANFVLVDEINRSSAKTQSAMLEAMQEKQVTIGGTSYRMPEDLFIVIATQNPIEQEGTYLLSEAQTDRFLIKEKLTYPSAEEEAKIMRLNEHEIPMSKAVLNASDIRRTQEIVSRIYIDESIVKYIAEAVNATRHPELVENPDIARYVRLGASPRASIALMKTAKVRALSAGRTYVIPEDVKAVRYGVLRHRISLSYAAIADKVTPEQMIDLFFDRIRTP